MSAYTIAELKTRNLTAPPAKAGGFHGTFQVISLAADAAVIGGARVREAMALMGYAHDGQYRKEPRMGAGYVDPYSIHPLRVMLRLHRLLPVGLATDDVLVAALLHDTLEDAPAKIINYYTDAPIIHEAGAALTEQSHGAAMAGKGAKHRGDHEKDVAENTIENVGANNASYQRKREGNDHRAHPHPNQGSDQRRRNDRQLHPEHQPQHHRHRGRRRRRLRR